AAVANVEDEATGTLAVTGAAQEGGSLAALLTATDADGAVTTAYRWQEKIAGVWTDIAGANTGTLAIPSDQSYVGKEVRAVATSTDPFGGTTAFEGTGQVIANVNDAPTLQAISLSTVENAAILLPIIPDHATDADGNALTLGVVTFDTMLWPSGFSLINPVTKQAVNLPDLKVQVSDVDGKSIYLTPAAELDWMASNQTITAKLKYTVTDSTGVSSTDDITLTIIGSTADKGKNLIGTNGADNLVGTTGKAEDVLQGGNGNDTLKGNDGTDALYGGNGDDKLYGDEGIDYLYGDNGNDQLFGGDAADVLFGGKGNDIYSGGAGGDHFVFESQLGADRVTDFKWSEGDKLHFVDFFSGPITAGDVVSKYAAATAGGDVVLNLQGGSIVLVGMAAGDGDWSAHLASAISFVAPT
uniref:calcium-binding protein n=1 Tax=Hydrogenophaga sp. OTU3427 TaxID=3043856 RepID=UPI00313CF93D